MGKRAEQRQRKTEQLLETATHIVADEGVEALTMHRLASEIGVAVGGLYRYFDSREALVVELQRQAVDGLREAVDAGVARAGDDGLRAVIAVARVWRKQAREVPERHRFIDAYFSDPRELLTEEQRREIEVSLAPLLETVVGAFERAADGGALDAGDAHVRTHVLWATLHGVDHFQKRDARAPAKLRTQALFKESLRALLVGWGAEENAVSHALKRA